MGKSIDVNLEDMKVLYKQGLSDNEIARRLGCSRKTIKRRREKLGLPVNIWWKMDDKMSEVITKLFTEGKSGAEIGKILNLSNTTITKFKKDHNIKSAFEMKMSSEDIEKAMQMAKEGYMDSEIAKSFNVSRGNIFLHRKRRKIKSQFSYDKISKIDNIRFEELFYQGLTDEKIAQELGMSADGVYSHRMKYGYLRESHAEAKETPLTQDNIEVILGIMMGDGNMEKPAKNARMSFAHCLRQKEYSDYIASKLSNLHPYLYFSTKQYDTKTGGPYTAYWCNLATNPAFNDIYEHFYQDGVKRIPIELFDNFTWQSLAFMYMDDGYWGKCGGYLCTNCFSLSDLEAFQKFLLDKFSLETSICKRHILYIKAKSFRYMKSQIKPYICECMKYKIRES